MWFRSHFLLSSHPVVSASLWPHGLQHCQSSLSLTISRGLPKFIFIASVMPSRHLILWHPLLLLSSIFPSIRDFSNKSIIHIRWCEYWPKYWSFSFSSSPYNEYSGLISLKLDWFDLLTVQGTLRSILSTIVQKHQFFIVLPSLWSSSHNRAWSWERP